MATAKKTKKKVLVKKTATKKDTDSKPKRKIVQPTDEPEDPKGKLSLVPRQDTEKFKEHRKGVLDAKGSIDTARWQISKLLWEINDQEMYIHWNYPDWKTYVTQEVGINVRTSQYYMALYQYFEIDLKLEAKDKQKVIAAIKKLGWTKSKCLIDVATEKNVFEWLEKAQTMSGAELEAATKKELNRMAGKKDKDSEAIKKTVSFKVSEEQMEPIDNALELAEDIAESDKKSHLFALICQDFVASNMAQKPAGKKRFTLYMNKIGAMFGYNIIAVDKVTNEVVHNANLFDKLRKQANE